MPEAWPPASDPQPAGADSGAGQPPPGAVHRQVPGRCVLQKAYPQAHAVRPRGGAAGQGVGTEGLLHPPQGNLCFTRIQSRSDDF